VRVFKTSSHRRAGVTSGVHNVSPVVMLGLVQERLDSGLGEAPGTSVERLFLTPDDVLCIRIRVEVLLELLPWEGIELLDARNGNILQTASFTLLHECGVHLTCAENNAVDFFMRANLARSMSWVLNDPLEMRLAGEFLDVGASERVAQKRFGEEEDERLSELAVHLATQQVEVVRWLSAVGDLDVAVLVLAFKLFSGRENARILADKLQVALHAGGRVFRSLSIITVRQAHDKAGTLEPLDLTRCDELVNDDLSGVGEVTKLGFPHNESVGRRKRVSVLETEPTQSLARLTKHKNIVSYTPYSLKEEFAMTKVA
jgi:hypothetical protein